jgi:hypothetical protein
VPQFEITPKEFPNFSPGVGTTLGVGFVFRRNADVRPVVVQQWWCSSLNYAEGVPKFQPRVGTTLGYCFKEPL